MILRLIAYGPINYARSSGYNIFDGVIATVSLADVLVTFLILQNESINSGYIITIIRATRIMRIFKFARFWRGFKILL
jgi:hypothetical protein